MTITAISTAIGEAGIGIVRISGRKSLEIINNIFRGNSIDEISDTENRKMVYGHILDYDKIVDEVLVAYMKGPKTYTREDMVEIYCHGGIISVRKVLELGLKNGARLAERGEFTKRAFLNGRLDLSQAEAVIDLIKSKTDKSFEASLNQLEGSISREIEDIRNLLLAMIAHVEVSIDFPDEDFDEVTYDDLSSNGQIVVDRIKKLLATAQRGKILRDGLNTVILGKPNVGKSSLLNAILRENRAIVTDIPGTTRDIIEEYVNIDGIPLKIIDTAGIRITEDLVEQIGVNRAKKSLEKADLIIGVFDASSDLTDEDYSIMDLIKDKKSIVLLNKTDLPSVTKKEDLVKILVDIEVIDTSIEHQVGIDILEEKIKEMFYKGQVELDSDTIITNMRHKNLLEVSLRNIEDALNDIDSRVPIDCIEVYLKDAWESLGEISGDSIGEDILDKIFADFCLGK